MMYAKMFFELNISIYNNYLVCILFMVDYLLYITRTSYNSELRSELDNASSNSKVL
jgi:hypothetical protein